MVEIPAAAPGNLAGPLGIGAGAEMCPNPVGQPAQSNMAQEGPFPDLLQSLGRRHSKDFAGREN